MFICKQFFYVLLRLSSLLKYVLSKAVSAADVVSVQHIQNLERNYPWSRGKEEQIPGLSLNKRVFP